MAKKPISSENANRNELQFISEKIKQAPNVKIRFYDCDDKPVSDLAKLFKNHEENKVDVILTFCVKKAEDEIEEEEYPVANYLFINQDTREKYLANKKEALIKNLYKTHLEVETEEIKLEGKEKNLNNLDNIKTLITKSPLNPNDPNNNSEAKLDINVTTTAGNFVVLNRNIRLYANFNLPKKVEYDELITFPSPPKTSESFWTGGKIISACVVIGIIAVLIFFYRKKIWSWIKREDETKKKEQVEIF